MKISANADAWRLVPIWMLGPCSMCALIRRGRWVIGSIQGPGQPLPVKGTLAVWSADLEATTDLLGFWRWNKAVAPCWLVPSSIRSSVVVQTHKQTSA